MKYKVLIAPVEPSINDEPNFSGLLAEYQIEASSEAAAEDLGFVRFCEESPFRSHDRDDYTVTVE
jgi:hypothetical protein